MHGMMDDGPAFGAKAKRLMYGDSMDRGPWAVRHRNKMMDFLLGRGSVSPRDVAMVQPCPALCVVRLVVCRR